MISLLHAITTLSTLQVPSAAASTTGSEPAWADTERGESMEKILILDGNTRSALAATRSLGRRGVPVVVADQMKRTLSGSSEYCGDSFTYPSPTASLWAFLSTVKAECSQRGISVIFPMTDVSMAAILKHRAEFQGLRLPFVEFPTFEAVSDKWKLLRLAQQLNITIPQTHYITDNRWLERLCPII